MSMNPFRHLFIVAVSLSVLALPTMAQSNPEEVQDFIDRYTTTYVNLYKVASEAEWASNTVIIDGVETIDEVTKLANEALSQHTGSVEVIETVRGYLDQPEGLTPLQVKQLKSILYTAANSPQNVPDLVKERIAAENKQNGDLFGFTFTVDGQEITPNEIDKQLEESTDLEKRRQVWVASKEVGKLLKDGLAKLVQLRNKTVQSLGYDDYFSYQVADYGMTTPEMIALNDKFVTELWPLYRELHTWARYELAERYGAEEVPDMLPADWLPNRWGQDWSPIVTVEGLDLDAALAAKGP